MDVEHKTEKRKKKLIKTSETIKLFYFWPKLVQF